MIMITYTHARRLTCGATWGIQAGGLMADWFGVTAFGFGFHVLNLQSCQMLLA